MANPKSRGIGTGAAQVYDYSRIDRAAENAMRVVGAKQQQADLDKKKAAEKKAKALSELQGEYGDYDTSNIREADKQALIDSINEGRKILDGHWEDVVNGDPYWTNIYQNQVMRQKKFIGDSADAKKTMTKYYGEAISPESGYSPERIKAYEDLSSEVGVTVNQLKEQGLLRRDQIIGNIFNKADASFADKGDELYKTVDRSYVNPDGGMSSVQEKVWLEDSEAMPKFKAAVDGDPELLTDMSIKYGDLPSEKQYENFYNDYKTSRINEWKKTDVRATPTPKPPAGSGGAGIIGADFTTNKGYDGFVIDNPKKLLQPISFTIAKTKGRREQVLNMTPVEFYKKGNQWRLRGNVVKDSWQDAEVRDKYKTKEAFDKAVASGEATSVKGDLKDVAVNPTIEAAVKAKYGIEDMDAYLKSLKGEGSGPSAQDLINKYK